jgi:hypothetical protein
VAARRHRHGTHHHCTLHQRTGPSRTRRPPGGLLAAESSPSIAWARRGATRGPLLAAGPHGDCRHDKGPLRPAPPAEQRDRSVSGVPSITAAHGRAPLRNAAHCPARPRPCLPVWPRTRPQRHAPARAASHRRSARHGAPARAPCGRGFSAQRAGARQRRCTTGAHVRTSDPRGNRPAPPQPPPGAACTACFPPSPAPFAPLGPCVLHMGRCSSCLPHNIVTAPLLPLV